MYVCFVLNNAFLDVIQSTPLCQAYGTNNDISPLFYFSFYKPVYYLVDEATFPSDSKELRGCWVGVSYNVGHFMTYKILMDNTHQIIHRSNIRLAADQESTPDHSEHRSTGDDMVIVNPQELLGRTFLMDTQEDGQRFCTHIVEYISDHESNVCCSNDHVKFRISVNEDEYKEIITYNKLLDFIEKNQENDAIVWQF
jgi:hypothetical protein